MANKPITPEEMKAYVDATWEKCQTEAWQEPRKWQGLTEAEKVNVALECGCADVAWMHFADAIEAKLREKNR